MSAAERIAHIVEGFRRDAWKSDASAQTFALAHEDPSAIADLVRAFFDVTRGSPTFVHDVLALMPEADWDALVAEAMSLLETDAEHSRARHVVDAAAFQAPRALRPVSRVLALAQRGATYHALHALRAASDTDVSWLRDALHERGRDASWRRLVLRALLETRRPEAMATAIDVIDAGAMPFFLRSVDHEMENGVLRSLATNAPLHVAFADGYLEPRPPHILPRARHPSWPTPATGVPELALGGRAAVHCSLCDEPGHRLLTLDPVPPGLGVSGTRLDVVSCLSCLGDVAAPIWAEHDQTGEVRAITGDRRTVASPRYPSVGLAPTRVALVDLGSRWARQDWGSSNGRENLARVGGAPTFIQSAEYPTCSACHRTCTFLMQLDSYLPTVDGSEWLWGSGGIGYVFWCDACRRSACTFQCT